MLRPLNFPRPKLQQTLALVLITASALMLAACSALNDMSEEIPKTFREFAGGGKKTETSGEVVEPENKKVGAEAVTVIVNGQKALPQDGKDYYYVDQPIKAPAVFTFQIENEEELGKFQYALMEVARLDNGLSKAQNRFKFSEREGRGKALYPGCKIDLNNPDTEKIRLTNREYGYIGVNHWIWTRGVLLNQDLEDGTEFEIDLTVYGPGTEAAQKVRFRLDAEGQVHEDSPEAADRSN